MKNAPTKHASASGAPIDSDLTAKTMSAKLYPLKAIDAFNAIESTNALDTDGVICTENTGHEPPMQRRLLRLAARL